MIIREGEDPEPAMAAMIASGPAHEDDLFIVRTIVAPPQRLEHPARVTQR